MIEIARNFLPLLRSRHDGDPLLEPARLMLRIPRHDREVTRRVRAVKAAALAPIAIDAVRALPASEVRDGLTSLPGRSRRRASRRSAHVKLCKRRLEAISNLAAVAAGQPAPSAPASSTSVLRPAAAEVSRAADRPV